MDSEDLPPHRVEVCVPERRERGLIMFNVRPGGADSRIRGAGWMLCVDRAGRFPLNLKFDSAVQDVCRTFDETLLVSLPRAGVILEVTLSGEFVRQWHAAGRFKGKAPPSNSVELDLPLFHHRIAMLPNGHLLLMTAESRVFSDWPEQDDDRDSARGNGRVVGDVIVELTPAGEIVKQWKMLDVLDPYRLCYGSCSGTWRSRGFPDSYDWSHGNAVTYDGSDDSILVSLRHQDCIIKLDRSSGELKWILGDHGNWRPPWSSKLLKPIGPLEWQYHQHDCSVTPSGTILCFDNGNFRAVPPGEKMAADRSSSRAVEYAVDEREMTVRQVWSYERPDERLYACYQGGAYRLPKSGNTFINYGGICTINGVPTHDVEGECQARLIEVTPDQEIVFDLRIGSTGSAMPLCSFRSEFVPE